MDARESDAVGQPVGGYSGPEREITRPEPLRNVELIGGVEPSESMGYVVFQYWDNGKGQPGNIQMDEFKTYPPAEARFSKLLVEPPPGLKQLAVFKVLKKTTFLHMPGIEGRGAMGRL